jgi:prephenate dehydratase
MLRHTHTHTHTRTHAHTHTHTHTHMYSYRQCLVMLRHHERVWIDAASYLSEAAELAQQRGDSNAVVALEADVVGT